jgi:hypothetical protein
MAGELPATGPEAATTLSAPFPRDGFDTEIKRFPEEPWADHPEVATFDVLALNETLFGPGPLLVTAS